MQSWWFDSWSGVARVVTTGLAAYALLILVLRISGKRTLSKLDAFDLVVTVAMGSTLATVLLSSQVPLAEGLAGFVLLVAAQFLIAKASVRWRAVARLVRSEPRLLLADGRILDEALVSERVTRGELLAALRQAGCADVREVAAVVLETDGSFSVLRTAGGNAASTLEGVRR